MLEKTLNARKNIILLRSFFAMVLVFSLALCFASPVTAYADKWSDPIDYTNLDYTVRYGAEYNIVTVPLPVNHYRFTVTEHQQNYWPTVASAVGKDTLVFNHKANTVYDIRVYPAGSFGMSLEHLPVGAKLQFDLILGIYSDSNQPYTMPSLYQSCHYTDENFKTIKQIPGLLLDYYEFFNPITLTYTIQDVDGAKQFVPYVFLGDISFDNTWTSEIVLTNVRLELDVPVAYWQQWQTQQNGEMLGDIKDELGGVNDKLDDVNSNLATMPDKFGEQMQGVIDKENEKAESSGNKFVNQILDKLPDPSTEVLTALKKLTDATAYTGTDAKLSIPAIVIPEIGGLIPETELWGGAEFSFSDYLGFLPPTLVTVVQSLFTIAIVLFCVYELKGIISYCLTLNDKKGG